MPAWPNLSIRRCSDLAHYITTFSPISPSEENVPKLMMLPSAPDRRTRRSRSERSFYEETGCVAVSRTLGRGDGPSAPTLKDDFDHPIRAADLAQQLDVPRRPAREDIFRTMSTGFNGTPMPSFSDSLTPEQRWAITDFIVSLSGRGMARPGYTNLVSAPGT